MDRKHIPLFATAVVFIAMFGAASLGYRGFGAVRNIGNLFGDNAVLGVAAVGMTFVILSGGIDLSVGSVVAFTTVLIAWLIGSHGVHPAFAILLAIIGGAGFGWLQGSLIQRFELPAFLVTLGGMFFARGLGFAISMQSVEIRHSFYTGMQGIGIPLGGRASLSFAAIVLLVIFAIALFVAHCTVFGRNIYALGGNPDSARLMGLPVARIRPAIYAISGLCSALAGVVATLYTGSGNPASGNGLELDAIAVVVIGGTLLSGGVGYLAGTLLGVLIFGTIQAIMIFDGRFSSWWLRIAVGALLLAFIMLQRLLTRGGALTKRAP